MSDAGVMSLAYGCPELRALDLCGCVRITGIPCFEKLEFQIMIRQSRLFSVSFIPFFGYYDLFMDMFVVILLFTIINNCSEK